MNSATFEARALAAHLSLTVEIYDDDHGSGLLTFRLMSLTGLLFWLGAAWDACLRATLATVRWFGCQFDQTAAWLERWRLYGQLAVIGLGAICWGVRR
jgi:hypothetical protein